MVDTLNAEVEALEAHRKEREAPASWRRLEQARSYTAAMKTPICRDRRRFKTTNEVPKVKIPIPKTIRERLLDLEVDGSDEFPLDKHGSQSVRNTSNHIAKTKGRKFVTRALFR